MISRLIVDDRIRSVLGDDVVADLRASLVPVDCQTCGEELLAEDEITLAVDDILIGVGATLHHRGCRPSES